MGCYFRDGKRTIGKIIRIPWTIDARRWLEKITFDFDCLRLCPCVPRRRKPIRRRPSKAEDIYGQLEEVQARIWGGMNWPVRLKVPKLKCTKHFISLRCWDEMKHFPKTFNAIHPCYVFKLLKYCTLQLKDYTDYNSVVYNVIFRSNSVAISRVLIQSLRYFILYLWRPIFQWCTFSRLQLFHPNAEFIAGHCAKFQSTTAP